MKRKANKIKDKAPRVHSPPKAKVRGSTPLGCATLSLPSHGETVEIPPGFEVVERIAFKDFEPRLTLFLRQTYSKRVEIELKSQRGVNRSARGA